MTTTLLTLFWQILLFCISVFSSSSVVLLFLFVVILQTLLLLLLLWILLYLSNLLRIFLLFSFFLYLLLVLLLLIFLMQICFALSCNSFINCLLFVAIIFLLCDDVLSTYTSRGVYRCSAVDQWGWLGRCTLCIWYCKRLFIIIYWSVTICVYFIILCGFFIDVCLFWLLYSFCVFLFIIWLWLWQKQLLIMLTLQPTLLYKLFIVFLRQLLLLLRLLMLLLLLSYFIITSIIIITYCCFLFTFYSLSNVIIRVRSMLFWLINSLVFVMCLFCFNLRMRFIFRLYLFASL